jgi:hypothetical protein
MSFLWGMKAECSPTDLPATITKCDHHNSNLLRVLLGICMVWRGFWLELVITTL